MSSPTPDTPHARRRGPFARTAADLAEDMRELVAFTGSATEQDLARIGWTPEQLKALAPEAIKRLGKPAQGGLHG